MSSLQDVLSSEIGDRYIIERELGRGGMATVYLAHDLKHKRPVALKVLRADLALAVGAERFQREIEIAARLQHPYILSLHDSGQAAGTFFYVMEYLPGLSLEELLERHGPLSGCSASRSRASAAITARRSCIRSRARCG